MSEQPGLDIDVTVQAVMRAAPPATLWAVLAWHGHDERWRLSRCLFASRYEAVREAQSLAACWTECRILRIQTDVIDRMD